jgi:cytidylate kinase
MSVERCPLIIAIDGPAGAGKSTVAARLAARFGLLNLETGAMYRAFALKALEQYMDPTNADALEQLSASTVIRLEATPSGNRVLLDGTDVTSRIRQPDVTQAASQVSVHPAIRRWMVDLQRQLGAKGGIVMEGRDIGTVVFPNAEVKIFLDAAPEVRGMRRYDQMGEKAQTGSKPVPPPEEVIRDLRARDERDRNRADSPLRAAPDAFLLDSTNLTLDEAVKAAESAVDAWLKKNNLTNPTAVSE